MMRRALLVSVALAAVLACLAVYADAKALRQTTAKGPPSINTAELAKIEKEIADKYGVFRTSLLTLQQRLANSPDEQDRARAAQLKKVFDLESGLDVSSKFSLFVKFLGQQKLSTTAEIAEAVHRAACSPRISRRSLS